MKNPFPSLILALAISFFITSFCQAQTGKIETLSAPPKHIVIDGDAKEWGDSLRFYNAQYKIGYALANTKDTLYMAVRVDDRMQQIKVLRSGITLSIDTKGKKKETYSITFPVNPNGSPTVSGLHHDTTGGDVTEQDREELLRDRLTSLRGIKVKGFKDVEGEMITTSNTYGFQTAENYDDKGSLVCEAAIPLSFFHDDDISKNEWAFNFKINGVQRKPQGVTGDDQNSGGHGGRGGGMGGGGMGGGGRGGRGGRGGNHSNTPGEDRSEFSKTEDFWEKFYLAH
jgi:uncharacterized membrane protein YgcG